MKNVYTIFLAIFIALFVGWGIQVFYEAPKMPQYPTGLNYGNDLSLEEKQIQKNYDQKQNDYFDQEKIYNRNVSPIIAFFSIVLMAIGLLVLKNNRLFSDSVLLSSVFVLVYAVSRGTTSDNAKVQFISVTAGLIIAIVLGIIKFAEPKKS